MDAATDEQTNESQGQAPPPLPVAESESQPQSQGGDGDEEDDSRKVEEELVAKAQKLMDKITSAPDNPKPTVLHALASILEDQESKYSYSTSFGCYRLILFLIFGVSLYIDELQ